MQNMDEEKSVTADSSFLINIYLLGWLHILCEIYKEVLITPTVKRECNKIREKLEHMPCITYVELSKSEEEKISKMLKELKAKFPGEHRGEVECLVVADSRNIHLLLSDNFAPWYLRSKHNLSVKIERGYYAIVEALEINALKRRNLKKILEKMEGVYPKKIIEIIRRKFGG